MPSQLDPKVESIRSEYGLANGDFWELPQKRGTYCIKHSAVEIVAAKAGIKFDMPIVLEADSVNGVASIVVRGTLGDNSVWSIGECSPKNNKNSYPWAMAEKRGIDRVVLKLVGIHGLVYSEEEADDFRATPPRAPVDDSDAVAAGPSHLKANGKPEKGWRANGTRTSYWLKTNGSWDSLKAMLDDDLLDCKSLVQLEQIKTIYRDMAREQHWNKDFLEALTNTFGAHERAILNALDAEELAEIPLKDALNKSLAQHPLNAG